MKTRIQLSKLIDFVGVGVAKSFIFSIVIGILWFAVESSFIFMIQGFLLSIGLLSSEQVFLPSWYPTSIQASVIIFILFGLVRAFASMLKNHIGLMVQTSFTCHQRVALLKTSLSNAHLVSTKEIISYFSEVITQAGNVVSNFAVTVNLGCAALLFLASGFKLAPYETLIGVALLSVSMIPLRLLSGRVTKYGKGLVHEWESLSQSLLRGLKNNFLLSIYNQVDTEIEKGMSSIQRFKSYHSKYSFIAGFSFSFPMFIGVIIVSVITYMSVKYFKTEPMKLIAFFYVFIRLAQSAGEMSRVQTSIRLNLPGFYKLKNFYERINLSRTLRPETLKVIDESSVLIELVDLSFGYGEGKSLFENLNLRVGKSEVLLIKGVSGVGKSTLLSLILGLLSPNKGEVRINGISTSEFRVDLHKILAYVGPEPFLIEGSIRENLMYGLDENVKVEDPEIWSALESMELTKIIQNLKGKLDEHINDMPQLSTGQKQRLSFARAILRKPSLLILDEATANLDFETEKKIIDNIQERLKNCTTIVVTHKSSFDRIGTKEITLERLT